MDLFVAARIVAAVLLLIALGPQPAWFYRLLRLVVAGVALVGAKRAHEHRTVGWAWSLGAVALVFNPIVPFYLDRSIWAVVDFSASAILLASLRQKGLLTPPRPRPDPVLTPASAEREEFLAILEARNSDPQRIRAERISRTIGTAVIVVITLFFLYLGRN